jgi:nitrogen regulatory protein PII
MEFTQTQDFSLVTLTIPQPKLHACMASIIQRWPYDVIQFDCRGTLIRENWYQVFLPMINPECEILQFLVKDQDVEAFMQFCIDVNDLHLPGSGAILSIKCPKLVTNSPKVLSDSPVVTETDSPAKLKNNLYAIYALIQSGRTEQAIKAAIQAGSHGPLVYFVEGRGTRDRAGWLKITKKPYEEVVLVLVEDIDRESIKEALVTAGRVNALGGGVVFDMPIDLGLVNLPRSIGSKSQRSTNEQITAAIDQLMGNTDWRDRRQLESLMAKTQGHAEAAAGKAQSVLLNAILPRKYANDFLDQVLISGIPGANVTYAKQFSGHDKDPERGVQIHHELAQIRMVVPETKVAEHMQALQAFATEQDYTDVVLYEQPLGQVVRYQPKLKDKVTDDRSRIYRGAKV